MDNEDIHDRDRVYVVLASNRLHNAYDRWGFTTGEWGAHAPRADLLLDNLSKMLNSNEEFELDDSFTLSFVHVR